MSRKRFLSLGLVLAILLCGVLAPLAQPSAALGAAPDQPSNVLPASGATGVSLTPTLQASPYFDSDNDTHVSSDWQISTMSNNWEISKLVYQKLDDPENLVSIDVPLGEPYPLSYLKYLTTYWWRVRYRDSGPPSAWSVPTSFTTLAAPQAAFTADRTEVGVNDTVTFANTSSGGIAPLAYQWDFGDGSPQSTEQNPGHVYSSAGEYSVSLTVTDAAGGTDTETKASYITVYAGLHADFVANRTAVVVDQPVAFTNLTSGGSAVWNSYEWDFGDGSPVSSAKNPTHTYTSMGTYTVVLTATYLWSSDNETKTDYITVADGLVTDFIAERTMAALGQTIQFTDQSTGGVIPLTYEWDFGDGSLVSTLQNPTHGYSSLGTYTVSLTVTDDAGNTAIETKPNYITVTTGLVVDFSADKTLVPLGESVQFTSTSSGGIPPVTYQWDFNNDGFSDSTETHPLHIYSSAGTYTVVLKVTDNATNVAIQTKANFITVNQPPGVPVNSLPANLATGVSLTPTLQSSAFVDLGDTHAASQWQITTVATNWAASLVFDNVTFAPDLTRTVVPSGLLSYSTTYYWRVRHQDSQEAWSAWSAPTSFTTRPPGTGADFTANLTALIAGQSVQFTDTSTGAIVSWTWAFGDGTSPVTWINNRPSDGKVFHTYTAAGTYTVALTVTDGADESYTETKPDYIRVFVLPAADFSVSATAIVLGEAVAFTNLSSGGILPLTYAWDFDDDGVVDSTSPNPSHSYGATGTYTVSLKVTDARGNSTTERRAGYISVSSAIAPHTIPPEGGIIQTADGRIAVTFPEGAVAGEATLNIDGVSASAVAKAPDGYKVGNTCFAIEAVDAGGRTVAMSSQWVIVTVKYSDEDVAAAGGKPENLVLARYNSATGKWTVLDTTLNKADRSLSANTTHFSTWAVMAKKPSGGMASWIWIILGIAAGLAVAALIVRAVAIERTGKAR